MSGQRQKDNVPEARMDKGEVFCFQPIWTLCVAGAEVLLREKE